VALAADARIAGFVMKQQADIKASGEALRSRQAKLAYTEMQTSMREDDEQDPADQSLQTERLVHQMAERMASEDTKGKPR